MAKRIPITDAVIEYLQENLDDAMEIAQAIDSYEGGLSDNVVDMGYFFDEYIPSLSSDDAFRLGMFAHDFNWSDDYVKFDGYGNVSTISYYEYKQMALDFVTEMYNIERIINREFEIPSELEELLDSYEE